MDSFSPLPRRCMKTSSLFNLLVEKQHASVLTNNRKAHDSLRTRLVKLFSRHKILLDSIGADDGSCSLSVSANFNADTGVSTFRIRLRQEMFRERLDFVVLDEEAEISARGNS